MTTPEDKTVYTSGEVAERLGVNHSKVAAWIRAGELAAINVALRTNGLPKYRITAAALAAFLARRAIVPPAAPAPRPRPSRDIPQYV